MSQKQKVIRIRFSFVFGGTKIKIGIIYTVKYELFTLLNMNYF